MKRDFENARDGRSATTDRTGTAEGLSPPPTLELKPSDIRAKDAQRAAGLSAGFATARDATPAPPCPSLTEKNLETDEANTLSWEDEHGYGLGR